MSTLADADNAALNERLTRRRAPAPVAPEPGPAPMVSRRLADVQAERVRWLWPGRIARGKVTVLAGHPGLGKSQVCASLAAIVTTGGRWPVDGTRADVGSVAILSAEDDAADTLKPRLLAAGADVRRVHVLDAVRCESRDGELVERGFTLADTAELAVTLAAIGDVALLVVDPISAYLGATDSHRNAEVRALLAPLSDMAARLGVAVVAVSHLNKGGSTDALARVTGSLALVAAARAAWIVARDPQDPARRLFLPAKNNLGADGAGLAFGIEPAAVEDGIETSRVAWRDEVVTVTASEALAAEHGADRRTDAPQRDDAEVWLRGALEGGAVAVGELQRDARADGLAWRTVRRAKDAIGARAARAGFGKAGRWTWSLPPAKGVQDGHRCPTTETVATNGESETASPLPGPLPPKAATIPGAGHLCAEGGHLSDAATHSPAAPCSPAEYAAASGYDL